MLSIQEIKFLEKSQENESLPQKITSIYAQKSKEEFQQLFKELENLYWNKYREEIVKETLNDGKFAFLAKLLNGSIELFLFKTLNEVCSLPASTVAFHTIVGHEKEYQEEMSKKKKKTKGILINSQDFLFQFQALISNHILKFSLFSDKYDL